MPMAVAAHAPAVAGDPARAAARGGIEVHESFDAAAGAWRSLEAVGLLTPYQRRGFVEGWWREIGRPQAIAPLIVVGRDERGEPSFLWALGRRRRGPITIAEPLGGKHANFHFGPWSCAGLGAGAQGIADALAAMRAAAPQVDLLLLRSQAARWRGRDNPFVTLPGAMNSASDAYGAQLSGGFEAYLGRVLSHDLRKQVRAKGRKFAGLDGFSCGRADTAEAMAAAIAAFLSQKAGQFAQMGIPDPFAAPGAHAFLDALAQGRDGVRLDLYALRVEGRIVAVFGGVGDGRHFCGMLFSYDAADSTARLTPGYVLAAHAVEDLAARGYESFDLGTGEARYKNHFCDETLALFDIVLPITPAGRLYAGADRLARRAKRTVKRTPALWNAVARLRRLGIW